MTFAGSEYSDGSSTFKVPGYNPHAGLVLVDGGQALDPLTEIGSAADHFASKQEHILGLHSFDYGARQTKFTASSMLPEPL